MVKKNMVYFGTQERMTWLRAPDANYDGSRVGWDGNVTQYLNGGVHVSRSTLAHRTFNLSWNMMGRDEIRAIMDYADGLYGDGAIYYLDPFAMDKNLLPQQWAVPALALDDPFILVGSGTIISATRGDNAQDGFPTRTVTISGKGDGPGIYIPIPAGYSAYFGIYGTPVTEGPVAVTGDDGKVTFPPVIATDAAPLFSNKWNGDTVSGITLNVGTSAKSPQATVRGMMLRIYPNGTDGLNPFLSQFFVSGQGHSGLRFAAQPTLTQYSYAIDKASLSATLVEDQAWR